MESFEFDYNKLFDQEPNTQKGFDVATAMNLDIDFEDDETCYPTDVKTEEEEQKIRNSCWRVNRPWTDDEVERLQLFPTFLFLTQYLFDFINLSLSFIF